MPNGEESALGGAAIRGAGPGTATRSPHHVRTLTAADLGLAKPSKTQPTLADDDPVLERVRQLRRDGFGGVVLRGPPGTGKTWYAQKLALKLVDGDEDRTEFVQFHPAYQYEDFVEGYVPRESGGGFELKPKHLLKMCKTAREHDGEPCVLVVDELSRADPGRVFGEALTYIEQDKREMDFSLASGKTTSIPPNLFFIATMNVFDKGVDDIDAALERRFAHIPMDPDPEALEEILEERGVDEQLKRGIIQFFHFLQGQSNRRCRIGHAYFRTVQDEESLHRLWENQLSIVLDRAFRMNEQGFDRAKTEWDKIFANGDEDEGPEEASSHEEAEGGEEPAAPPAE